MQTTANDVPSQQLQEVIGNLEDDLAEARSSKEALKRTVSID